MVGKSAGGTLMVVKVLSSPLIVPLADRGGGLGWPPFFAVLERNVGLQPES
jgi:hypothetical protein